MFILFTAWQTIEAPSHGAKYVGVGVVIAMFLGVRVFGVVDARLNGGGQVACLCIRQLNCNDVLWCGAA
jgi:hypothetical protein